MHERALRLRMRVAPVLLAAALAGCAGSSSCSTFEGMEFRQPFAEWDPEEARAALESLGFAPVASDASVAEGANATGARLVASAAPEGGALVLLTLRAEPGDCAGPDEIARRTAEEAPRLGAQAEETLARFAQASGWTPQGEPAGQPLVAVR